jgi:hypothetical protein
MKSLLYIVSAILFTGWILGAFVFNAGSTIYVLLVMAVIGLILGLLHREDAW